MLEHNSDENKFNLFPALKTSETVTTKRAVVTRRAATDVLSKSLPVCTKDAE